MQFHSVPPIPSWRPNKPPRTGELPFSDDLDMDLDDFEPLTPEPPEYGPAPAVVLH